MLTTNPKRHACSVGRPLPGRRLVRLFLVVTVCGFMTGCTPKDEPRVDSEKTMAMIIGIPNRIETPSQLEVYQTGPTRGKDSFQSVAGMPGNLVYRTTKHEEISNLVSVLRFEQKSVGQDPKQATGYSYHILFYMADRTNVLYYICFVPNDQTLTPFVRPNTSSGYAFANSRIKTWIMEKLNGAENKTK